MEIVNPAVRAALEEGRPLQLEIGGGDKPRPGFFNIDRVALPQVDIVADLGAPLALLPDDSVVAVHASHVLEHVPNLLGLMEELYRVCRSDATIEIVVPHYSNPLYWADPTHVRPWSTRTIAYFMDPEDRPGRDLPAYYTRARFRLLEQRLQFSRLNLLDRVLVPLLRAWMKRSSTALDTYERRFAWLYPADEIRISVRPKKPPALTAAAT